MRSLTKTGGWFYLILAAVLISSLLPASEKAPETSASPSPQPQPTPTQSVELEQPEEKPKKTKALRALEALSIKGRAAKTGYSRELFADTWEYSFGCDTRNRILQRDLQSYRTRSDSYCVVESGVLIDPYTGATIKFVRGVATSLEVQIDHVVSLSDAWQKGAQQLSATARYRFYNDPLNLLAVSGSANSQKGDSDAASWLPANKAFRCDFIARQIAVKRKYQLWVTQAESDAMARVLRDCPNKRLPSG